MTKEEFEEIPYLYGSDMWDQHHCICREDTQRYINSAKEFLKWLGENGYRVISEDEIRKAWSQHKDNPDISKLFTDLFTNKD